MPRGATQDSGRDLSTTRKGQRQRAPALPAGARLLFPAWQRERARRIHCICRCVERRIERGKSMRQAVHWFACYWKGRTYRSGHQVRLSAKTIVRLFYRWQKGGRTPSAVALRYWKDNRKLPLSQVLELARACIAPGVRSFRAAWRQMQNPAATPDAFWHAFPIQVRAQLVALCAARRRVEYLERTAQRSIDTFTARIPHANP